ncbi:hypothetical protein B0H13DRAFT_1920275 [Mycena leptocephala]|nr:hypothetical protein B0H13DRAFT_1920275 [Mycena leptocephala]
MSPTTPKFSTPDTDSEEDVDVAATKKPWVTRPPTYRSQQVLLNIVLILFFTDTPDWFDNGVIELHKLVAQDRKERVKAKKPVGRSRRSGEPKNVPLPRPPASKRKVPRNTVSADWLENNKDENDMPSRIEEAEEP